MLSKTRLIALLLGIFVVARLCLGSWINFKALWRAPTGEIRNVMLVVFDTLRADRLSLYGHNVPTTPFLDAHKGSLVVFKGARSAAPWTIPSHATMFTGKLPSEHLADWGHMVLGAEEETIAETLSAQGFCTSAFVANHIFKMENLNLLQGFQSVYFPPMEKRQEKIMQKLESELDASKNKECRKFVFVNFMNNHLPYNPGKYAAEFGAEGKSFLDEATTKWQVNAGEIDFTESDKQRARRLYDASVRYSDELIERLIALLAKQDLLENTLLIITSDHGDGLGYHQEVGHEISVWDEQLAVPLIVRFPGGTAGGRDISDIVSLVGLHSFILYLTENASYTAVLIDNAISGLIDKSRNVIADYRNYFTEITRDYNKRYADKYPQLAGRVQHMHVLYCGNFKLHVHADGSLLFFDIAKDPLELTDVQKANESELRRCETRYHSLVTQGLYTPFDFVQPEVPNSQPLKRGDVETLKSLGYL